MEQNQQYDRPLDDIEAARLHANLRIFFSNEVALTHDTAEQRALRIDAANALAEALANPEANNATAQLLIDRHAEERAGIGGLYAYYSLVRRARERHPDSKLPHNLLSFIQERSEDEAETDITCAMMLYLSEIDEADVAEEESTQFILRQAAVSQAAEVATTAEYLAANVDDQLREKYRELLDNISDLHAKDLEKLELRTGDPLKLLVDLQMNGFMTAEGLAAARAQQDSDRLSLRSGNPDDLYRDIQSNRFMTPEGRAAAQAHQDSDRLALHAGKADDLLRAIRMDKFTTAAGKDAAEAQQDSDRLLARIDDPASLFQDIQAHKFQTPGGIAAAKAQQDSERLKQGQTDRTGLRRDLSSNKFLTAEGINEARRLLDLG